MPAPAAYSGAMTARVAQAIFRWAVDPRGSREVKDEMEDVESRLGELRSAFFTMMEPAQDLGMLASQFEALGFEVQDYGRRMTESMTTFAEDYIDNVEEADDVSRAWMETQGELEAAHQRMGKVSAQQLLPFMKMQKDVIVLATKFAENYPEIAQIAFGIGTAMVLATSLANAVSKGIRMVADVKLVMMEAQRVMAAKMIRDAANKQLAAGLAMQAAAKEQSLSTGGVGVGGLAKGVFSGAGGAKGIFAAALPFLAVAAAVAAVTGAFLQAKKVMTDVKKGTEKTADAWVAFTGDMTKSSDGASDAVDKYRRKQEEVKKIYDEIGGPMGSYAAIILKGKLMNKNMGLVRKMLIDSSNTFEDYEEAIDKWNGTLEDGEAALIAVSKATWDWERELRRLRAGLQSGETSLKDYGQALIEQGNIFQKMTGTLIYGHALIQEQKNLSDELLDDYQAYKDEDLAIHKRHYDAKVAAWEQFAKDTLDMDEQLIKDRLVVANQWELDSSNAELDAAFAREDALEQFGKDAAAIEERIAADREQAMLDFKNDMDSAETDYYKERMETAADFGEEVRRSEQDHQREMRRMAEDSGLRQKSAIRARDALALLDERREYERDRRRSEEDYSVEAGRRNADYAKQMIQMEAAFAEQSAERVKAYEQQLVELKAQKKAEQKARDDAYKLEEEAIESTRVTELSKMHAAKEEELNTLDDAHDEQETELKDTLKTQLKDAKNAHTKELNENRRAWDQQLKDAGWYNDREYEEYQRFRKDNLDELTRFVNDSNRTLRGLKMPTTTPDDFSAGGGYAGYGLYRMGETGDEFVMDSRTTKAAEKMAGGRLSQERLLAAMAGGGSKQAHVDMQLIFPGANVDEKKVGRIAYEQTYRAIHDVFKEVD